MAFTRDVLHMDDIPSPPRLTKRKNEAAKQTIRKQLLALIRPFSDAPAALNRKVYVVPSGHIPKRTTSTNSEQRIVTMFFDGEIKNPSMYILDRVVVDSRAISVGLTAVLGIPHIFVDPDVCNE